MSFRPWKFWSRLRITHTIRWKWLSAYALVAMLLATLCVYVTEQATLAITVRSGIQASFISQQQSLSDAARQLEFRKLSPSYQDADAATKLALENEVKFLRSLNSNQVSVSQPYLIAIYEAVFFPLSNSSRGSITTGVAQVQYVSPAELRSYYPAIASHSGPFSVFGNSMLGKRSVVLPGVLITLALALLLPVGFVLLPSSRRLSKVRLNHVLRVLAYSASVVGMTCFAIGLTAISTVVLKSFGPVPNWPSLAIPLAGIVALNVWWAFAIRRYFKMHHGWIVAPALTVIVMLVTLLASAGNASESTLRVILAVIGGGLVAIILVRWLRRLDWRHAGVGGSSA